jgi:ribonuclease P protein component
VTKRFSSARRLNNSKAIQAVFKNACAFKSKYCTVLIRPTSGKMSRLAVIASKKKVGNAVARNRFRRLTKESFRHYASLIDTIGYCDVVVIAKKEATQLDNQQWFEHLQRQWQRVINFLTTY